MKHRRVRRCLHRPRLQLLRHLTRRPHRLAQRRLGERRLHRPDNGRLDLSGMPVIHFASFPASPWISATCPDRLRGERRHDRPALRSRVVLADDVGDGARHVPDVNGVTVRDGARSEKRQPEGGRLTVSQQLVPTRGGATFGPPKSRRSQRTVALDRETVAALREHREAQLLERAFLGAGYIDRTSSSPARTVSRSTRRSSPRRSDAAGRRQASPRGRSTSYGIPPRH